MNNKNFKLAIAMGLLFANGILASEPKDDKGELDINTIVYIEEEEVIDLGFDTADYLPEGFDPYKVYFDLDSVVVVEEEIKIDFDSTKNLPADFDAYSYPTDVSGFDYIDAEDTIELDFDTAQYLPEGFDAYSRS